MSARRIDLSVVVPVFNGAETIETVVSHVLRVFHEHSIEIVLVNDGSSDHSDLVCRTLANQFPGTIQFLNLARNFGEHHAVLAGLAVASGDAVAVLDDDGQHPAEEALRMWRILRTTGCDVIYGRYIEKQHSLFRNLGSRLNDVMATWLLRKPADLYLSSFKVMNRFLVDQILRYRGPFPYVDGLIFWTTRNIGQIDVQHRPRIAGSSGYTLRKLVQLWLNMFLGFSIAPLRFAAAIGLMTSFFSVLFLAAIVVDKLWINPGVPPGVPTILTCITFFSGVQLTILGFVGEYVGRSFLSQNGMPQYVIRESVSLQPGTGVASEADASTEASGRELAHA
ncbi:MAG: glycosyltransferase family 2 protein [Planctomycetaceae bacterium]|nr:glycosyltransferase family 2 protein [Planctomycetaceae bacterium]